MADFKKPIEVPVQITGDIDQMTRMKALELAVQFHCRPNKTRSSGSVGGGITSYADCSEDDVFATARRFVQYIKNEDIT